MMKMLEYVSWKKLKNGLLLLFVFTSIFSCSIAGITNDYGKLSDKEKEFIIPFTDFKSVKNNRVYRINGVQLKNELKENDKSLVVFFANGCKSKNCIPLSNYVLYANKNNLKLYLIMAGYENLYETLIQKVDAPLFSIDNEYYNSTFRGRYIDKFTKDLLGYEADFTKGLIYQFKKDSLVDMKKHFSDLNKNIY
ncbi:hypothetical protein KRX57_02300 [Weeksellaceae bacterium TAE3-ERU29]|nr:hypothetical protein [Weeksellaceae bacterium TAE3-ERU29]